MPTQELEEQLVQHIDEAYAMEQQVLRMLDSLIRTTENAELEQDLEKHRGEPEQQAERLKKRLEAYGASPSKVKEAGGILGAPMKSVLDMTRGESAGRNIRDAYATEHLEIASYQLLERAAKAAGDIETAEVARRNRDEEQKIVNKIDLVWDKVAELTLEEAGVSPSSAV